MGQQDSDLSVPVRLAAAVLQIVRKVSAATA